MGLKTEIKLCWHKLLYLINYGSPYYSGNIFDNKRIIIIGAADSSMNYLPGEEIDRFDLVIRINTTNIIAEKFPQNLGTRTDILFHALCPSAKHGLNSVAPEILGKQKTQLILYPQAKRKTTRRFYEFALNNPSIPVKRLPSNYWNEVASNRGKRIPTTGVAALYYLMKQNFKELHVTGFTFYKTDYVNFYEEDLRKETVISNTTDRHDPDKDFLEFIELYYKFIAEGKKIVLDPVLDSIIKMHRN